MQEDWKTLAWLTLVALCASAFRWNEFAYKEGKFRLGMLVLQIPTAFGIAVIAHAAEPAILHFFPYAGDYLADGITGVLSFAGPLVFARGVEVLIGKIGGKAL
jgi:hypothetical protein